MDKTKAEVAKEWAAERGIPVTDVSGAPEPWALTWARTVEPADLAKGFVEAMNSLDHGDRGALTEILTDRANIEPEMNAALEAVVNDADLLVAIGPKRGV